MKWKDFEDAVQSATAESVHADYIVTRNLKDFMKSKVIVNITVQMYPCSEGTDTGNPVL